MEATVEELTPLGVLKQPKVFGARFEVGRYSCVGEVQLNLAGARDIERRAILKRDMPAVPPPAWKLGFDQPSRSVNRARHIRGSQAKCTLELAIEFRRATGNGLDFLQKFPQIHFPSSVVAQPVRIVLHVAYRRINPGFTDLQSSPTSLARDRLMFPEVLQEQAIVGDGTVQPPAKVVDPEALVVTKPRIPFEVLGPAPKLL